MALDLRTRRDRPAGLLLLVVLQIICVGFFLWDVSADWRELGRAAATDWHVHVELGAALSLAAGIAVEVRVLVRLLRRKAHLERAVSVASAAMHNIVEAHFVLWDLTPAEAGHRDVPRQGARHRGNRAAARQRRGHRRNPTSARYTASRAPAGAASCSAS